MQLFNRRRQVRVAGDRKLLDSNRFRSREKNRLQLATECPRLALERGGLLAHHCQPLRARVGRNRSHVDIRKPVYELLQRDGVKERVVRALHGAGRE